MVVLVTLSFPAVRSGDEIVVAASGSSWPAIWRGESAIAIGTVIDVELEIDELISWDRIVPVRDCWTGVNANRGNLTVCGEIKSISDDVIAVDLRPGLVLVGVQGETPPMNPGELISFFPRSISLYPTGV